MAARSDVRMSTIPASTVSRSDPGDAQNPPGEPWNTLAVYSIYRVFLAALFSSLYYLHIGPSQLGTTDSGLYTSVSTAYLLITVVAFAGILFKRPRFSMQVQANVIVDIVALTLLMHASGGISSGLGILIAVSLASAALLVNGRYALLFAVFSTVLLFGEQIYSDINHSFRTTAYTYTAMLGALFFTISLLAVQLARRAEKSEAIAVEKSLELADQEQLNAHIIKHLQSAIIILDQDEHLRVMNPSALNLFSITSMPETIDSLSQNLREHFHLWKTRNGADSQVLAATDNLMLNVRFTQLEHTHQRYHMIFLEDSRLSNQRVQQSKLASLGRLTASIAHEIRNPLGAISHASQLLAECTNLEHQDQRLIEIIKDQTERVNSVIETVLQISSRRKSIPEEIEINPWLNEFVDNFCLEHQLDTTPFRIHGPTPDYRIRFDPGHLRQILDNLCLNALKYGRENDEFINIRVCTVSSSPCIEIRDQGNGISNDQVNAIFEPFFTTSSTGTGLGLYIARELAELNQSRLEYEPNPGGGCCFRIFLPDAEVSKIAI